MPKKTASLTFPTNALDAMRQLQDLDAPPPSTPETAPPTQAEAEQRTLPITRAGRSTKGSATRSARTPKGSRARTSAANPEEKIEEVASNPMSVAVQELLTQPYTADPTKAPVTVSTVKIPTEVWERLGWVATLTAQTKQDIITEALKAYFRTLTIES